jgi:hypothetical protein
MASGSLARRRLRLEALEDRAAPAGSLVLRADAGRGHHHFLLRAGGAADADGSPRRTRLTVDTTVAFHGGGASVMQAVFDDEEIDAPLRLDMAGGKGDDVIEALFAAAPPGEGGLPGVELDAPLTLDLAGGGGDDHLDVLFGWDPQGYRVTAPAVVVNAPLSIDLEVADSLVARADSPQTSPTPPPQLNSRLGLTVNGGPGRDGLADALAMSLADDGILDTYLHDGRG